MPSEAQVQTEGASTEAKETECTKVISLSLAANNSDAQVFFSNHITVTISTAHFSVSGHSKKTLSQLIKT
jgi:hypothetical protein